MSDQNTSRRVGMISLGCPKNRVDSEVMLGELAQHGYDVVNDLARADTVIVNTCGFIDEAKQESIDTILEIADAKERGDVQRLVVAGCMVNRYGQELSETIPEIDAFVGLDDLAKVATLAGGPPAAATADAQTGGSRPSQGSEETPSSQGSDETLVQLGGGPAPPSPAHLVFDHTAPRLVTTRGYAYLKVAEGCNNPCTFCAIPHWRGRFRSRTIDSLVTEARKLEQQGVAELCLIAQDTTRYGEDLDLGKHGLTRLAEALLEATDIPWIRFLYAYPTTLDAELMALMGREERFCSYIDMPLQHSHPDMLKAMRRGGRASTYLRQLAKARELAPDVFLRTTFIVGFPGETEEHFEHLLDFVREARFDHLGAFAYSPEPDTPAAELTGRVPKGTARRRYERLLEVQEPIARQQRQRLVGRTLRVLVEGVHPETEHLLVGRHHGMAPEIDGQVLINDGQAPAGTFADVQISDAYADDVVGHVVGPVGAPGLVPAEAALEAAAVEAG